MLVGRGFEATYRQAGGDPVKDEKFIHDILGQANMAVITPAQFHDAVAGKLQIPLEDWHVARSASEQPDEKLLEYIEWLRQSHKTAVLSNANKDGVVRRIGEAWVRRCFDKVIVSGEIGMVKPDPEIYRYTAEQLDVLPEECVFVDDSRGHVQGAEAVGMQAVLYRDFEQLKADLKPLVG